MGIGFAAKGYEGKMIHGSYSVQPLKISGRFHFQGPQPISEEGAPEWVAEIFNSDPDITQIAVNKEHGGVVWTRITP